jgi:hypothetical protein
LRVLVAALTAVLLGATASLSLAGQDRAADLRSRFEHEANPIQKAKMMPDLGDAEFQQIRKQVDQDHFQAALGLLRQYQAQADTCMKGLAALDLDPEKHPTGFKQLQISVQEALRRIEALLPAMTADEQAPFLEIRKDLEEINHRLIDDLFPGQTPPAKPTKAVQ